jgi:hypothetical protein
MRNAILFAVYVLAMANVLIWTAVAGNLTTTPKHTEPQPVRQWQSTYKPNPVWI